MHWLYSWSCSFTVLTYWCVWAYTGQQGWDDIALNQDISISCTIAWQWHECSKKCWTLTSQSWLRLQELFIEKLAYQFKHNADIKKAFIQLFYLQCFQEPRQPVHWCAAWVKPAGRWKLVQHHVPPPEHGRHSGAHHWPQELKYSQTWWSDASHNKHWANHGCAVDVQYTINTCCVCQDVPEAMLVRAQAASNCRAGSSSMDKKDTKRVSRPASMISFRGGLRSWDSSFLWGGGHEISLNSCHELQWMDVRK